MQRIAPQSNHHYHFVTGRLAHHALCEIVEKLSKQHSFQYSIGVMPITVAALITPRWLRRKLSVPSEATHLILPGYCEVGIEEFSNEISIPVICGPNDCRFLPEMFGDESVAPDLDKFDIEIIAEINHAPRSSVAEVLERALKLQSEGADVIDFGCDPVQSCSNIGEYIKALTAEGLAVSVDTFDKVEAARAVQHGANLVLSVNSQNRDAAVDWGCEVVVVPDVPADQSSLDQTVEFLAVNNVPFRLDSILEPIGAGFTQSLIRYAKLRERFPNAEIMMGIGNLTELTDVDSAGVNLILLGICQELGIRSVLTTQVINWARTSVRECDVARRLVHYSVNNGVPPKRLSDDLVILRDSKLRPHSEMMLNSLSDTLKDNNYRIFAQPDGLHLIAAGIHLCGSDPFQLFDQLMKDSKSDNVDPAHAFYLGYEMAKASIAQTLGKQYEQDRALNWGLLTVIEDLHRIQRTSRHRKKPE